MWAHRGPWPGFNNYQVFQMLFFFLLKVNTVLVLSPMSVCTILYQVRLLPPRQTLIGLAVAWGVVLPWSADLGAGGWEDMDKGRCGWLSKGTVRAEAGQPCLLRIKVFHILKVVEKTQKTSMWPEPQETQRPHSKMLLTSRQDASECECETEGVAPPPHGGYQDTYTPWGNAPGSSLI